MRDKSRRCKACDLPTKQRFHNDCYSKWVSEILQWLRSRIE